ncbi:heteromeric transposase endonuclease subunit TnsA [Paenibacillus naphthalenovorans]|uniref:heteromeric transposase endonuclease subunit TnsA n=1 Tax=Paenibacillus naphthalenovorans TaxID=162209 RepID=UPI0008831260|nr:heteromeric transposase endonuclease subunit TnsA [Paenibacillus naphthalenovorans]SDJ52787.1 TnsA endonuclease C terminal [Paenibacillus naphthalenovorans]
MAKRSTGWTENKIARYEKEGRGKGEFGSYKPWLTIQDVPSEGRSHRPKGWKTKRIHHLLSDLELKYFHCLEWADDVIDIREQFPIDREATLKIAEEKGINHPTDNESGTPIVSTTDFLITVRRNGKIAYLARSTKPASKVHDKRAIEKLEIEREYWTRQNVSWGIVTERNIEKVFSDNMKVFHPAYFELEEDLYSRKDDLLYYLSQLNAPLSKELLEFDRYFGISEGSGLALFKHLVATKVIGFDIKTKKFHSRINSSEFSYPHIKELGRREVK